MIPSAGPNEDKSRIRMIVKSHHRTCFWSEVSVCVCVFLCMNEGKLGFVKEGEISFTKRWLNKPWSKKKKNIDILINGPSGVKHAPNSFWDKLYILKIWDYRFALKQDQKLRLWALSQSPTKENKPELSPKNEPGNQAMATEQLTVHNGTKQWVPRHNLFRSPFILEFSSSSKMPILPPPQNSQVQSK